MFEGLSPMAWLFIAAALAFGFGLVKFMISQRPPDEPAVPSVQPYEPAVVTPLRESGDPVMVQDSSPKQQSGAVESTKVLGSTAVAGAAAPRRVWHRVLGVAESADAEEIEKAAKTLQDLGIPDSMQSMLVQLRTVRGAMSQSGSVEDIEERIENIERQLGELVPLLIARIREIEDARNEGMELLTQKLAQPK